MSKIFITSTGTNIGKTLITSALSYQNQTFCNLNTIKPIISGWEEQDNDCYQILQSLNKEINQNNITATSPWRFKAPLSPDMAALKEGKNIDFQELLEFCKQSAKGFDKLIIEGAGGIMTPINQSKTMLDLIKELGAEVILVVGSYLGTISHTLNVIEVIKFYNLPLKYIVISESENNQVLLTDTKNTLANFIKEPIIIVPRIAGHEEKWRYVPGLPRI